MSFDSRSLLLISLTIIFKVCTLSAIDLAYKAKYFKSASTFCKQLLELINPNAQTPAKVRQVLAVCERKLQNETQLNYDPRIPFTICGATLTPICKGSKDISCLYCAVQSVPEITGVAWSICALAIVSADGRWLMGSGTLVWLYGYGGESVNWCSGGGGVVIWIWVCQLVSWARRRIKILLVEFWQLGNFSGFFIFSLQRNLNI